MFFAPSTFYESNLKKTCYAETFKSYCKIEEFCFVKEAVVYCCFWQKTIDPKHNSISKYRMLY
jgi:hypothetical protein